MIHVVKGRRSVRLACPRTSQQFRFTALAAEENEQITLAAEIATELNRAPGDVSSKTYASLLRRCGGEKSLSDGKCIHAHIARYCQRNYDFLANLLVQMYGKCGSVEDARSVFDGIPQRNVYSWSLMMGAYARNGHCRQALQLYWEMFHLGIKPDNKVIFLIVLGACSQLGALADGRSIQAHVVESGLVSDALDSAIVNMYGKCGSPSEAKAAFDRKQTKNLVTWSAMIAAYAQNGYCRQALDLYRKMDAEDVKPNHVTFIGVVEACSIMGSLAEGRAVHARVVSDGFDSDIGIGNALINMYSKCRSSEDAWKVFSQMQHRNVVSWNCMISAYAQQGHHRKALELYQKMEPEGIKANSITFISALGACSNLGASAEGRKIHSQVIDAGYMSVVTIGNALVNMYAKCGKLDLARRVFDEMAQRNDISWNSMIAGYTQNGQARKALELYEKMDVEPDVFTVTSIIDACSSIGAIEQGKAIHAEIVAKGFNPDGATGNALITMYGKCGSLEDARTVFNNMQRKDVVSWTAMLTAYAQSGLGKEALQIYQEMKTITNMKPNEITLISVLDSCSIVGDLAEGRLIHAKIDLDGLSIDGSLGNALVNMYGKCGSLHDARKVFDKMHQRDVVCWSSLIAAYAQQGHGADALKLSQDMCLEGVQPDSVTFITILFACSHAGLLREGRQIFLFMCGDCGNIPAVQHYKSMIDLLARAGWLAEAEDLMSNMPFEPDNAAWMTLLGSYNLSGNYQRGVHAAEQVIQSVIPATSGPYVMLSNIYANSGEQVISVPREN